VLRFLLVDGAGAIRQIYSARFLDLEVPWNDLLILLHLHS